MNHAHCQEIIRALKLFLHIRVKNMMSAWLHAIASVGVTPRSKQLGVTPRTPLFEGKNPENQKLKISIKKGRLLLVNDQGFSQIRPT